MRRVYTDTAHFRAPYASDNISFAGLGSLGADHRAYDANKWPTKRSYFDVSQYRMPYRAGYFQSGALRGLGDDAPVTLSIPTNVGLTIQGFWPTLLFVGLAGIGVGALFGKVK